jgi:flagellar basal-body rod modification protein FlgD
MSVTPTTAASVAGTSPATGKGKPEGTVANTLTGDFNTFLRLLTAQMQNQDPLEPTSNTEFIAQLASFSAVEQQVVTNATLETLLEEFSMGGTSGLAQWIGKEVMVPGGQAAYNGKAVTVNVTPVEGAERAELLVRNADGALVARVSVDPKAPTLTWNGRDQNGQLLPQGGYSFGLDSYVDGTVAGSQKAAVFSPVSEVRLIDGVTELVVEGGATIAAADVTAIR